MGFWPFGGAKRQRAPESDDRSREKSGLHATADTMARLEKAAQEEPRRLSKTRRSSAGPPHRSQTESVSDSKTKRRQSSNSQIAGRNIYHQQNPTSQSSLGPENFYVVRQAPTLHARRNDYDPNLPRRKSSKRKAEDYAREREIRAMSSSPIPIPKRPATFQDSNPLQKETRNIPGNLNRKLRRPTSQVSLPIPETLPDRNDAPHQNSFKIGTFAALSPRPTVRYDNNPRADRGKQPLKTNAPLRLPIPEEDASSTKRIDELADDLDAGGLRELMERDRRRREKKKEYDRAKLQRKLQRRLDRQKEEEEMRRARTEEYVSRSTSRLDEARGVSVEDDEDQPGPSSTGRRSDPFADPKPEASSSSAVIRNPFADEKDLEVEDVHFDDETEPAVPVRSPLRDVVARQSSAQKRKSRGPSPPTSPQARPVDRQSLSQASLMGRETTPEVGDTSLLERRASDQSSQRMSNWTSFFKRGTRRKLSSSFQGRSTPSEFSNTSRESFAKRQPPPIITERTFRRAGSGTPQRTTSKFREDLPELPISPPDSRVQSPEAAPAASVATPASISGITQGLNTAAATHVSVHQETTLTPISPTSGRISRLDKGSMDFDSPVSTKAEMPLSQSLASVDSEGSWLSGKPLKRLSGNAASQLRQSISSLQQPARRETGEESADQEGPGPAVSREENGDNETWHSAVGKQPHLVRQASRAKSKEGLLNEYRTAEAPKSATGTDDDEDQQTAAEEAELQEAPIMRARSVEYKGHARHISAGSARLLDLRRGSVQSTSSVKKDPANSAADLPQQVQQ